MDTGFGMTDAIVIGAGPNGLVAANLLADAGWDVLVLEANPEIGGAVRSAEDVTDGFVHDTFSSFYPLAAVSRTIRGLDLEQHGLVWRHAPAVAGTPFESDRGPVRVTVSAGIAQALPTDTIDRLVTRADQALYSAKAGGRDRVVRWRPAAGADG